MLFQTFLSLCISFAILGLNTPLLASLQHTSTKEYESIEWDPVEKYCNALPKGVHERPLYFNFAKYISTPQNVKLGEEASTVFNTYFSNLKSVSSKVSNMLAQFKSPNTFDTTNLNRLLPFLGQAQEVTINPHQLTDEDVVNLAEKTNYQLRHLDLGSQPVPYYQTAPYLKTPLKSTATSAIGNMQHLTSLNLRGCGLDREAIEPLTQLKELTILNLGANPLGHEGLAAVSQIASVTSLSIPETRAPADTFKILSSLKGLVYIDVSKNTGLDFKNLESYFPCLKALIANGDLIMHSDLSTLAKCSSLARLHIDDAISLWSFAIAGKNISDDERHILPLIAKKIPTLTALSIVRNPLMAYTELEKLLQVGGHQLKELYFDKRDATVSGLTREYMSAFKNTLVLPVDKAEDLLQQQLTQWTADETQSNKAVKTAVFDAWMAYLKSEHPDDIAERALLATENNTEKNGENNGEKWKAKIYQLWLSALRGLYPKTDIFLVSEEDFFATSERP